MKGEVERAEVGTRRGMSRADRQNYCGIARHPLARRWMLKRLVEARENAAAAQTETEVRRWDTEAERVGLELRRCGVDVEGSQ